MIGPQHERVTAWLAKGNLRPTRQRLALATLLVGDGENRHVTAESLYALCAASGEKVSLATVYNTLRAFCAAELVNEIVVDGARSYFDTRMDDHAHFYLEDSHDLTDVPTDGILITGLPDAPVGMQITRVDVVIRLRRSYDQVVFRQE
jgi:Fur family iron response transcriptional regulator